MESMKFINPQALVAPSLRSCATARALGFINFVDSTLCPYNYYIYICIPLKLRLVSIDFKVLVGFVYTLIMENRVMLYTGHAVDDSSTTAHVKSCLVEIYVIFQSTLR